jgi:hypothetical protein
VTPASPEGVRQALRRNGVRTSHDRKRQGVRVPNAATTLVSVDFNDEREAAEMTAFISGLLHREGFTLELPYPTVIRVTGRAG